MRGSLPLSMACRAARSLAAAAAFFMVLGLAGCAKTCSPLPVAGGGGQISSAAQSVPQAGPEANPAASAEAASAQSAVASEAVPAATEPAVMKAYQLPEGFVYVDDIIPDAVLEIRYATAHNFTAAPIDGYEQPLAILTTQAAQALKTAAELAAQDGWRLHLYDAYRPQQALDCIKAWELTDDTAGKAEFYPNMEKSALFTDGYLSKYSRHTRGSTVDLTLERADTGALLDTGGPYDLLDPLSNYGAQGLTPEQHANRVYLRDIMDKVGFDTIATEWWHFQLRGEPYPDTYFDFPIT